MDIKVNEDDNNINMLIEPSLTNIVNKQKNEMNKIVELEKIQERIERMNSFNQIEVLKIFYIHKDEVTLNENKNGILINLTDVPMYIIEKLYKYISYVESQEKQLDNVESEKDTILNNYFN